MVRPRILFVAGPGDVQGTYRHWKQDMADPTIPNVGYSAQVYDVVRAIGGEVLVATTHSEATEEADGFATFRRVPRRRGSGLEYHRTALNEARRIRGIARDYAPDVMIVQATVDHAWLLADLPCKKRVASLHNALWPSHRPPTLKERTLNRLNARFYRSCRRVFCVSEMVRRQVAGLRGMPKDVPEVQVPLYRRDILPDPRPSGPPGPHPRVIYTGRIVPEKGVFDLLDVAEALPDTVFDIVGGGPAYDDLSSDVARRGLRDRVILHGQMSGRETLEKVAKADLLVCPTHGGVAEGLAKTPIEAAILGVPSVVSAAVPAKHVVAEACRVVPTNDVDALVAAVSDMLQPSTYTAAQVAAAEVSGRVLSGENSLRMGLLRVMKEFGIDEVGS